MDGTLKVASTGRFGSRYGVGIRRKLLKIEPLQYRRHPCPSCGAVAVKRKGKGIFACRKCSYTFVGGSYLPHTLVGGLISKMVVQKSFVPEAVDALSKAKIAEEKGKEAKEGPAGAGEGLHGKTHSKKHSDGVSAETSAPSAEGES